ncbi:dephospho-CoA kinase [Rhizosaccharibacter radicis]|uniref:Dephospho-CoA kinase n=1 Tax=Rhizosaccharibacter radicis TaxID=2782605 RepID=A0ABT1VY35_9PROT|nr:dephospho-CoA kinase [Acetobacteraceae bacterium KSS12]
MKVLGLTGGIGMGKSTVAAAFRRAGLPVFDADREVHRLQQPNGRALPAIGRLVPGAVVGGRLDRAALRRAVVADPALFRKLEGILHPMVRAERRRFLQRQRRAGRSWVVLDIPLLFETAPAGRRPADCDLVAVVSASPATQLARVRRRRSMSAAEAASIIARQMPDGEKRRRADVVIHSGLSRWQALREISRLLVRMRAWPTRTAASRAPSPDGARGGAAAGRIG